MVSLRMGKDNMAEVSVDGEAFELLAEATYLMAHIVASMAIVLHLPVEKVVEISNQTAGLVCKMALDFMESPEKLATEVGQAMPMTRREV